ncbi:hypothetical protein K2X33_01565, partial [bacterium]|nr:hypothetical protein [bacterium]
MRAAWVIATCLAVFSGNVSYAKDWYATISSIYAKGAMPDRSQMKAGQAWFGRCATSDWRTSRTDSAVFFHVDPDPLSGATFRMVPLFEAREFKDHQHAEDAVKRLI